MDGAVSLRRSLQEDLLGLPQLDLVLRLFLVVLPVERRDDDAYPVSSHREGSVVVVTTFHGTFILEIGRASCRERV